MVLIDFCFSFVKTLALTILGTLDPTSYTLTPSISSLGSYLGYGFYLDIDECQLGTDTCSHECSDTDGSYECDCPAGMKIDTDQRTCIGTFYI